MFRFLTAFSAVAVVTLLPSKNIRLTRQQTNIIRPTKRSFTSVPDPAKHLIQSGLRLETAIDCADRDCIRTRAGCMVVRLFAFCLRSNLLGRRGWVLTVTDWSCAMC